MFCCCLLHVRTAGLDFFNTHFLWLQQETVSPSSCAFITCLILLEKTKVLWLSAPTCILWSCSLHFKHLFLIFLTIKVKVAKKKKRGDQLKPLDFHEEYLSLGLDVLYEGVWCTAKCNNLYYKSSGHIRRISDVCYFTSAFHQLTISLIASTLYFLMAWYVRHK